MSVDVEPCEDMRSAQDPSGIYLVLFAESDHFERFGNKVERTFEHTLLYSVLHYSTLPYSTLLYSTELYATLLYSTLLYSTHRSEDNCWSKSARIDQLLCGVHKQLQTHVTILCWSTNVCGDFCFA